MDEIPEDVRVAAEALAKKYADDDMAYYGLVELAVEAIMAERERCAKIADEQASGDPTEKWDEGWFAAATVIATAIRKGPTP